MERKMSKREATRQARAMVEMRWDMVTWPINGRWLVGIVGNDGTFDCCTPIPLRYLEACAVRRGLVAYWAGVILSGEEVAYV